MTTYFINEGREVLRNGYHIVPIRKGAKRPAISKWQTVRFTENDLIRYKECGVGVLCGQGEYPVVALDIDTTNEALAVEFKQWCIDHYGYAPERTGNAPKTLLLYRIKDIEQPKRVSETFYDKEGKPHRLEVLGKGQQFVAYHIHPDTNRPYEWMDLVGGIAYTNVKDLTLITPEQIKSAVRMFEEMAIKHGLTKGSKSSLAATAEDDPLMTYIPRSDMSLDHAKGLLKRINCRDYDDWLYVGMALHFEFGGSDEALNLWDAWSMEQPGYRDHADLAKRWHGLTDKKEKIKGGQWLESRARFDKVSQEHQLQVTCASSLNVKPVTWLWDGWLPEGMLTILAGQQAQGKTTICMSIAAMISSGGRYPDGEKAKQGNVLIWSGEDIPEVGLLPKLAAMGANLDHVYFVGDIIKDGEKHTFQPDKHMDMLLEAIENIGNVKLLIIDPIVSAVGGDDHKNNDVRRALQPIIDTAAISGMSVIGITHYRKGSQDSAAIERVIGSLAYTAAARSVWCVGKLENENGIDNILVRTKASYSQNGGAFKYSIESKHLEKEDIHTTGILWGGYIEGSPDDLLAAPTNKDEENVSAVDEAKEFIIEYLTDVTPSVEFMKDAKQAGISERTMKRARKALKVKAKKYEGKWYLYPSVNAGGLAYEKQECKQDSQDP